MAWVEYEQVEVVKLVAVRTKVVHQEHWKNAPMARPVRGRRGIRLRVARGWRGACTLAHLISIASTSPMTAAAAAAVLAAALYTQIGCMEVAARMVLGVLGVRTGWRRIRTPVDDSQVGTKEAGGRSFDMVDLVLNTGQEVGDEAGGSQEAEAGNGQSPN